jgi:hypothetical protein
VSATTQGQLDRLKVCVELVEETVRLARTQAAAIKDMAQRTQKMIELVEAMEERFQ